MKRLIAAAALLSAASASAANHWVVNASFDDGATLTGYFNLSQYGFLTDYSLHSTAAGSFAAFAYSNPPAAVTGSSGSFGPGSFIQFYSNGYGDQHLTLITSAPLTAGAALLLTTSFEDIGYDAANGVATSSGPVRYIAPGSVLSVPEPASWTMLIIGFGLTGAICRRRYEFGTDRQRAIL